LLQTDNINATFVTKVDSQMGAGTAQKVAAMIFANLAFKPSFNHFNPKVQLTLKKLNV